MRRLILGNKIIDDNSRNFVIAEIGHNHMGDLSICKEMFLKAKENGADAVKLQKRDNLNLYTKSMLNWKYISENAYGKTYGEHRLKLEFNLEQYQELKAYADTLDLIFFATPFDENSVEFLEKIDIPIYKISSSNLKNYNLIKKIGELNKPILISTGGSNLSDIKKSFDLISKYHSNICIMQCVSNYPANYEDLNLKVIKTLKNEFKNTVIGFSSHDTGVSSVIGAYYMGARIFEKHFTLNRAWKGTDQSFSLEPLGLFHIVRDLERARLSLGDGIKQRISSENKAMKKMEQIIVSKFNIEAGETISRENIILKIPNPEELDLDCLYANQVENIINKKTKVKLSEDQAIKIKDLE